MPDPIPSGLNWYVVQTKPRNEARTQSYLSQHTVETFLPMIETPHCAPAGTPRLKPLFPSYLFARFSLQSYPLVKWGKGVSRIVGFGKYPTPLAEEVVSIIKNRADERAIVKRACNFNKEDPVRITSGPLRDLLGIFDRWVSDSGRVKVLLNLIGYQPAVLLHYSQLERVG